MYVAASVFLPNSAYYPQQIASSDVSAAAGGTTPASHLPPALARTLTYNLLELASLFRLDWVLRRRLQFSPISQLAFRLESQWRSVQAALILYVSYIIESTLAHRGGFFSDRRSDCCGMELTRWR